MILYTKVPENNYINSPIPTLPLSDKMNEIEFE